MADLWGSVSSATPSPTVQTDLAAMTPDQMVEHDASFTETLQLNAVKFKENMEFSQEMCRSIFELSNFVPNLSNNEQSAFWKGTVIPSMVKSLTQETAASNAVVRSLASVRDLAITIQKSGEIVKQTKGSEMAVKIARENIGKALSSIDNCIEKVSALENQSLIMFAEQAPKLLEIIGPSAADFAAQRSSIEVEISNIELLKLNATTKLSNCAGKVERSSHLIHVTQARVQGAEQALAETKLRSQKLLQMNAEVDEKIKAIPDTVEQRTTTESHGGWWFWRHRSTHTTVQQVKNPDKEAQKNYYESVIASRLARYKETQGEAMDKDATAAKLNEMLAEYKEDYKKAMMEYDEYKKDFDLQVASFETRLKNCLERLKQIDSTQLDVENRIGLKGPVLISCLIAVKSFLGQNQNSTKLYSPLISVLEGIKTMVKADVQLLLLDDIHVFLAGNRLLNQVGFLNTYAVTLNKMLPTSRTHAQHAISAATEFKLLKN